MKRIQFYSFSITPREVLVTIAEGVEMFEEYDVLSTSLVLLALEFVLLVLEELLTEFVLLVLSVIVLFEVVLSIVVKSSVKFKSTA